MLQSLHRTGVPPRRCEACSSVERVAQRRRSYVKHGDKRRVEAMARHYALTPRQRTVICSDCHGSFTFAVSRGSKRIWCDECTQTRRLAVQARYRDGNREALRESGREYMRVRMQDPEFREAARVAAAEQRRRDPERTREIRRAFYQRNAEKMRQRRKDSRVKNRLVIYERDGGICHICGGAVPLDLFEVDHIFPVSRGGASTPDNLATSHRHCNRAKAARLVEEVAA